MGLVKFLRRLVFRRKRAAADRVAAVDFEDDGVDPITTPVDRDRSPKLLWDDVEKRLSTEAIGYGGFSAVYFAQFGDGSTAAVKRYWRSERVYEVYKGELDVLRRVQHDSIVKLLGYCDDEEEEGALILEFVPNGTLHEHLHGLNAPHLPWRRRMAIVFQLAQVIAYLHHQSTPHIVHADIKPSNILLDDDLNCKLCDFGSAKIGFSSAVVANRKIMVGSPGYVDPTYIRTGLVSKKNDVYSFGVVVLELITGLEGVDPGSGERLTRRAEAMMRDAGKVAEMLDRRLGGEVDLVEAKAMVEIAAVCVCGSSGIRPSANDIVAMMSSVLKSSLC